MKEIFNGAVPAILILSMVILLTSLSTFFGGISGLIVGLFFTDTILDTLSRFGVNTTDITMWQVGATLGFISGFFKSAKIERVK